MNVYSFPFSLYIPLHLIINQNDGQRKVHPKPILLIHNLK